MSFLVDIESNFREVDRRFNVLGVALAGAAIVTLVSLYAHVDHDKRGHDLTHKHAHRMPHDHAANGASRTMNTSSPIYLSGVGGWY